MHSEERESSVSEDRRTSADQGSMPHPAEDMVGMRAGSSKSISSGARAQALEAGTQPRLGSAARQRRAQTQHLALERSLLQRPLGEQQDVVHVEGLGEVVVRAPLERLDRHPHLADGRDQDDDRGRIHGQDAWQHLDPGLSRHALVEHDEVDFLGAEQVERRGAVLRLEDVARSLEDHPDRRADPLLVVDDEHGAPARELGRLVDHGWRDRSITRYSARPPLDGRWTKTRTPSPGLSCASIRKSAAGSATGFLPTSTMTSPRRRPARSAGPPVTTSVTSSPPAIVSPSWAAASPLSGSTPSPQLSPSGAP